MMELLPLPPFHHILMATILVSLLLALTLFVAGLYKRKKRISKKIPSDIYEISMELQRIAPNNPQVQRILQELSQYKYNPNAPKVPKELIKRAKNLYKKLSKE